MPISPRKQKILQAVVEDYINTARAISSADVQAAHLPELSSATIRNELAALEEMGYLSQPHTSAGRVPTPAAYRLYIEQLMPARSLTAQETELIRSYFSVQVTEMRDVLKKAAKVISEITHYTAIARVAEFEDAVIENIRIVRLNADSALVIVVTDRGVLKDSTVRVANDLPDNYFDTAAKLTLAAFRGRWLHELSAPDAIIEIAVQEFRVFFEAVLSIIAAHCAQPGGDVLLEGVSKIFDHPEYSGSVERARQMIGLLEESEQLLPILEGTGDMRLSIDIGKQETGLDDCAIVSARYVVDGKTIGQTGVIGPIRMNYAKVVSVLDVISRTLRGLPLPDAEPDK
ncbi:MAG: heat-inducible transcriptional repressor HrcA [Clostridiales bacterium]|jgi:heat-inducible transcriptional repressor|nr:heat-inducible transcriptional repressor HrcA [Clostridiales bacterium]